MKAKVSIIYSWLVRSLTYFLPNHPIFMRLRGWLYSFMMKDCGKDFQVASSVMMISLTGISVGNHVYIAHNCVLVGTHITLGDEVLIGPNCIVSSGNHTFLNNSYRFGPSIPKAVRIEEGCWIAGNCSIIAGANLPKRSILAAGAVLNKEFLTPNSLYGGVPAKLIKQKIN